MPARHFEALGPDTVTVGEGMDTILEIASAIRDPDTDETLHLAHELLVITAFRHHPIFHGVGLRSAMPT